ncbi:MAG: nucleotidyl transferase AbiEii/AbiGii toxin family protein [Patescibacteria group bacterium]
MFEKVISKNAKNALAILGKSGILQNAYMAGGTALALQINHRFSFDFDFFTVNEFNADILSQRIKKLVPEFKLERKDWGTILGTINKTRFSLFFYTYPLLFKTQKFLDVEVADIKDIAPMKIAAISDRGSKKDFIDLYFIIEIEKKLTLEESLELYDKKFRALKENKAHILKSLNYFEDADKQGELEMIKKVKWKDVKNFFKKEIPVIANKFIG